MNKIIFVLMMILVLLLPEAAMAVGDSVTSYTPMTTGFTVTITANVSGVPESAMNFTGKLNSTVYPIGTNNGAYRWGYMYNTGNTLLSFQMAGVTPANIVLNIDAKSDMKHSFQVTNRPGHPSGSDWNGWRYVSYNGYANIFATATFGSRAATSFNIPINVTATTVDIPLSITSSSPMTDPTTVQGAKQTFKVSLNRTANVIWYINGSQVQTNVSITSANYVNSAAMPGIWNVAASATDGIYTVSRIWNWTVSKLPNTTISWSGTLGNSGIYISNVTVTLSATDDRSGINYTTYRINGGSWLIYTMPFLVTTQGNDTIRYYSVDNAGNVEATKSQIIQIDMNPPGNVANLNGSNHGSTYINWTWTDPGASDFAYVMVYLNGVFQNNVAKGIGYYNATNLMNNTQYTINTHTVDNAGNINTKWVNNTVRTNR
jgi:hypothetical protein